MGIVIQLFFRLLAWAIVPLTWKVVRALGFTAVAYVGIDQLLDQARSLIMDNISSLPAGWINALGILQIDVVINIYLSAYLIRAIMWGMDRTSGTKTTLKL